MNDPLKNFDWSNLYQNYDNRCKGYSQNSVFLCCFGSNRPESDRELYYLLINQFSEKILNFNDDPLGNYEALLYWKLYSQSTSNTNLMKWLRENELSRNQARERLLNLLQNIPPSLDRNPTTIIDMVRWLGKFNLPGMASSSTLPVRTTFLHFLYPNVVPIFDQMVLKAVGSWENGANHKITVLSEYLPFAWMLTERYADKLSKFTKESPIRGLDMALWVGRGRE